ESRARRRRHVSSPERPGMLISSSTRSVRDAPKDSRASPPLHASSTTKPLAVSEVRRALRSGVSSSTINTRCRGFVGVKFFSCHGNGEAEGDAFRNAVDIEIAAVGERDLARNVQAQTRAG